MTRIGIIVLMLLSSLLVSGQPGNSVVLDSISRSPLPEAPVFNRKGKIVGICGRDGTMPDVSISDYPLTVRYLGYKDKLVPNARCDTILMQEEVIELSELIVSSRNRNILHILAYEREFSTLTTWTDTVFLFREKMVDYMLSQDKKQKFKSWTNPRVLASRSYYHFTNAYGLDSVSDRCSHHFSWADWVGIPPTMELPVKLHKVSTATDTIHGKYTPAEVWLKSNDSVRVDVNIVADSTSRRWLPHFSLFFRDNVDFERLKLRFNYDNILGDSLTAIDLDSYSFDIESNGRGHNMFRFNRVDEPFCVTTQGDIYIIDREFITLKEARQWDKLKVNADDIAIYVPEGLPDIDSDIYELIARVDSLPHDNVRLAFVPDHRLAGRHIGKFNVGRAILTRLKGMFGIDAVAAKRKWNRQWSTFRREQGRRNSSKEKE